MNKKEETPGETPGYTPGYIPIHKVKPHKHETIDRAKVTKMETPGKP